MNSDERILYLCEELQVMAFNLADEMEDINFHSTREAVKDMGGSIFRAAAEMQKLIRDLMVNLDRTGRQQETDGPAKMYRLLDTMRKCSVEHESYRNFLDELIPLLDMLSDWGDNGPLKAGQ